MARDARFFLTTKDGACTLGINAEGDPYRRLPKHVGVGLGGNSLPPRKDAHRRGGVPPLWPLADGRRPESYVGRIPNWST